MAKECWYTCEECGVRVKKRKKWGKPVVCLECGIKRAARAALEMRNKSGSAYAEWQKSAGPDGRPRRHDMWE